MPNLLRRDRNTSCCLAALLWATLQRNRCREWYQAIPAAVVGLLAHIGSKRIVEQLRGRKVAQRITGRADIRPGTTDLAATIDLSAARTATLEVVIEAIFIGITVIERDAAELPVDLGGLVSARINGRRKGKWACRAGLN